MLLAVPGPQRGRDSSCGSHRRYWEPLQKYLGWVIRGFTDERGRVQLVAALPPLSRYGTLSGERIKGWKMRTLTNQAGNMRLIPALRAGLKYVLP